MEWTLQLTWMTDETSAFQICVGAIYRQTLWARIEPRANTRADHVAPREAACRNATECEIFAKNLLAAINEEAAIATVED